MTPMKHIKQFFKDHVLRPLLGMLDDWEASVFQRPGALRGGENSPVRFNIPREGLERKGDHPPLPGFPRSFPHVIGSVINIRRSVRDLDRNPS